MGFFGMSGEGKDARKKLNDLTQQSSQWANTWGNNSQQQYDEAGNLRDEVLYNNRDVADNGMGTAEDARNQGKILNGDNSGWFDEQNGRLNDLMTQVPNSQQITDGVRSGVKDVRGRQGSSISDWQGKANSGSTAAYDKVRGNTANYADVMNRSSQNRADSLSGQTNGTYNAMADRVGKSDEALIGRNDKAYGGAKDLLTQSAGRLTSAMDANGATQMRASAPIMASAKARARAAGVDPNSPEAASLMSRVDQSRAHAVEDNLASNIAQQNTITGQQAQMGLDQERVNRGLAQDWTNQTNSMAAKQNELNRTDTNQQFDTDQNTWKTQFSTKNAADMGEYQDQRATDDSAQQQRQGVMKSEADDQYTQGQMQQSGQQQEFSNRAAVTGQLNDVSKQRVTDNTNIVNNGMNWANGQFNARQQGRNNTQSVWTGQNQAAQGWANNATGANSNATQGNAAIYNSESQNAGWGLKSIIGGAAAVGAAALGPGGALVPKKK